MRQVVIDEAGGVTRDRLCRSCQGWEAMAGHEKTSDMTNPAARLRIDYTPGWK